MKTLDEISGLNLYHSFFKDTWNRPVESEEFEIEFFGAVREAKTRKFTITKSVIDRLIEFNSFMKKHFDVTEFANVVTPNDPNDIIERWENESDSIKFCNRLDICTQGRVLCWYNMKRSELDEEFKKHRLNFVWNEHMQQGKDFALCEIKVIETALELDFKAARELLDNSNNSMMAVYESVDESSREKIVTAYNEIYKNASLE
jgi:hypothetical protein